MQRLKENRVKKYFRVQRLGQARFKHINVNQQWQTYQYMLSTAV